MPDGKRPRLMGSFLYFPKKLQVFREIEKTGKDRKIADYEENKNCMYAGAVYR